MLLHRAAQAQIKRLTNTTMLPDTCQVLRYADGDGYTAPDLDGTAETACRISLSEKTVDIGGGKQKTYAGTITLPAAALTFTPPGEDPEDFASAVQASDIIRYNGVDYALAGLGSSRLDGATYNVTAYLDTGTET